MTIQFRIYLRQHEAAQDGLAGGELLPDVVGGRSGFGAATDRRMPQGKLTAVGDGRVFISYVRDNAHEVDRMQAAFEAAAIPVWRDTAELWPGDNWRLKIKQAIAEDALVVVACFSKRSLARAVSYQNEELALAIEQLRLRRPDVPWLIPVRLDDCDIPDLEISGGNTLRSLQWADLFGPQGDRETARLVEAVRRLLDESQSATAIESARASIRTTTDAGARNVDGAEPASPGAVHPEPDARWANISGGIGLNGRMRPMSFEILARLASEWAVLLPNHMIDDGPARLLRTARSQFTYSWFNYEFMVTACLTGFQALEASFRVLYPDLERVPFRALIDRARQEGILPGNIAELADSAAELHDSFSHPRTQTALTLGSSVPMLENTHRLVALVMNATAARDADSRTHKAEEMEEDLDQRSAAPGGTIGSSKIADISLIARWRRTRARAQSA